MLHRTRSPRRWPASSRARVRQPVKGRGRVEDGADHLVLELVDEVRAHVLAQPPADDGVHEVDDLGLVRDRVGPARGLAREPPADARERHARPAEDARRGRQRERVLVHCLVVERLRNGGALGQVAAELRHAAQLLVAQVLQDGTRAKDAGARPAHVLDEQDPLLAPKVGTHRSKLSKQGLSG